MHHFHLFIVDTSFFFLANLSASIYFLHRLIDIIFDLFGFCKIYRHSSASGFLFSSMYLLCIWPLFCSFHFSFIKFDFHAKPLKWNLFMFFFYCFELCKQIVFFCKASIPYITVYICVFISSVSLTVFRINGFLTLIVMKFLNCFPFFLE